jgi:hypothetical protein
MGEAGMPKILMALVLGTAFSLPAATAFADDGNWGDRDSSGRSVVVHTEPNEPGSVACDHRLPVGEFRAGQAQC